jgi:hypothetical protein
MINQLIPIGLWTSHFVGDFLLQFSWMALGKSKAWRPLLAHIAVYTAVFPWAGIVYAVLNGIIHLCIDYITSRINARAWAEKRVRAFWIGVGFDQLLHMITLTLTVPLIRPIL